MFRKRAPEPTVGDVPDDIAPWELLEDAGIAAHTARVREHFPDRNLTAFARRTDQDALAVFDKGADGAGKAVVVLRHLEDPARAQEQPYPGFVAWFDDALAASKLWKARGG